MNEEALAQFGRCCAKNKQTNKNRLVVADHSLLEHDIAFIGNFTDIYDELVGRVAQSVKRLTTGWRVRDRIAVGTRFSARPDGS